MSRFKAGRYLALSLVAVVAPVIGVVSAAPAGAATGVIISEVAPWGSGNAPYARRLVRAHQHHRAARSPSPAGRWTTTPTRSPPPSPINGVTSIPAGQSAIFVEGTASTATAFTTAWFGASPPSGFLIGSYTGSGVGLSHDAATR